MQEKSCVGRSVSGARPRSMERKYIFLLGSQKIHYLSTREALHLVLVPLLRLHLLSGTTGEFPGFDFRRRLLPFLVERPSALQCCAVCKWFSIFHASK